MYLRNSDRIHHLTHGMLTIMLLMSTNVLAEETQDPYLSAIQPQNMTEEILLQGESALTQMTLQQRMATDWHRQGQNALAGRLQQQSSKTLVAIGSDGSEKKSPLANASEHFKQIKG